MSSSSSRLFFLEPHWSLTDKFNEFWRCLCHGEVQEERESYGRMGTKLPWDLLPFGKNPQSVGRMTTDTVGLLLGWCLKRITARERNRKIKENPLLMGKKPKVKGSEFQLRGIGIKKATIKIREHGTCLKLRFN